MAEGDDKKYVGLGGASWRAKPSYQTYEFDCPICHWYGYERVQIPGRDGHLRDTSLYRCALCTVTFTHPQNFSADRGRQSSDEKVKP